ncbi:hypothetical protein H009_21933 [Agrobacterium tumefaciens str. Cherry 2E-2-2]|nr:hypothetical protein H009_21933 [Agrobacterium tumefaciens str. Cherry 2E-2-2]
MTFKITALAAAVLFTTACTGSSRAETPEEAVMFMVFGVRDKDAANSASFAKTSDTPLTLAFQSSRTGMALTLMSLSVTKEDDCTYLVGMKPAEGAQNPMPEGKIRFDLTKLQNVTFKGMGEVELKGAALQCVESPTSCTNFPRATREGRWEAHFGPVVAGNEADVRKGHQQALNDTVKAFKANICKAR